MNTDISVDVAIIGAGTAGISAFKEAGKVTKSVLLIDHGPLGTTCARVGCMPSKVLIQAADYFHDRTYFNDLGLRNAEKLTVDMPAVMKHVRQLRDYFTSGIVKYVESLGNQFISGSAKFCGPNVLKVNQQTITAKNIIIATGTSSIVPNEWQEFSNQILISENIFEQEDFQKNIAVIGAGAIGLEIGQALSRLGIKIEMFHSNKFIGGLSDPVVNEYAIKIFQNEFPLHLPQRATLEKNNNSLLVKSGQQSFSADQVIAALGRKPNLENLNLAEIGIKFDKKGLPLFDRDTMKLENFPIYIAGDAGKFRPLLHEAADEGRITGYNSVRANPHCFTRRTPLMIIFSEPTIAIIGASYNKIKDKDFIVGEVSFENQGRSRIMMRNKGILHIYAERESGVLLGAEMIAPEGEHLAHLLAFAIQKNMTVFELLQMPFYHPVVEEGMRTALRHLCDQVSNKKCDSFELAMCNSEAVSNLS